jgi:predicted ATPase
LTDASTRTQVLVATQSVGLVDEMEPEDIIVANLADGATTLERLDSRRLVEWLQEYTLSQMWATNLFGGQP